MYKGGNGDVGKKIIYDCVLSSGKGAGCRRGIYGGAEKADRERI